MQTRELNNSIHKFNTEFVKTNAMDQDSIGPVDPDTDQEWQKHPLKKRGKIVKFLFRRAGWPNISLIEIRGLLKKVDLFFQSPSHS
jgi:hypothetical protein